MNVKTSPKQSLKRTPAISITLNTAPSSSLVSSNLHRNSWRKMKCSITSATWRPVALAGLRSMKPGISYNTKLPFIVNSIGASIMGYILASAYWVVGYRGLYLFTSTIQKMGVHWAHSVKEGSFFGQQTVNALFLSPFLSFCKFLPGSCYIIVGVYEVSIRHNHRKRHRIRQRTFSPQCSMFLLHFCLCIECAFVIVLFIRISSSILMIPHYTDDTEGYQHQGYANSHPLAHQ